MDTTEDDGSKERRGMDATLVKAAAVGRSKASQRYWIL